MPRVKVVNTVENREKPLSLCQLLRLGSPAWGESLRVSQLKQTQKLGNGEPATFCAMTDWKATHEGESEGCCRKEEPRTENHLNLNTLPNTQNNQQRA